MLKQQTPYCPHVFQQLNWFRPFVALLYLFGAVLYSMINAPAAHALTSGVTISSITPYAALDSNNSCSDGPRGMYLQVNVENTTGGTLTGLSANINSFSNSSFTLDSGESATRYIGNLAANQTTSLYWYVNYPCQSGNFPNTGLGPATNYTVTLSDSTPGTVTSSTFTLTTRSEISAQAGGDISSALIGAGAVPGQIVPFTVNYTFGNPASSAEAMIQPVGNISFDSSCYRLISTDITSSTFSAGPTTANDNRLYFTGVNSNKSSNTLTVVYNFISLCNGPGTTAYPFADLTSGSDQKYTDDYGGTSFTFPNSTNPFTITKSASSATLAAGGTVTYTVTISNPSSYTAIIDRITDTLPPNVTYGSLVTGTGNTSTTITNGSSSQPATGATGVINWLGNANTSYSLPAGGSLILKYTANVPNVVGSYANSATTTTGSSTIGPATTTVSVGISDLTLTKTHTGNFSVGTPGSYALTVKNIGTAASTGTITVTDTLPGGLTIPNGAVTLTGTNAANWSCSATSNVITCSSTNAIAVGGSSTFNLTGIQVGAAAAPSVTNNAVVSGGNEANASNNTATDLTNVKVSPTIDLDGNNSSGATGNDFKTSFALGGSAIGVVDANTSSNETLDTVITDSDSTQLSKAEIKLTNAQTNDLLTVSGSLPTGITLDPSSTATQIILTGTATRANYESALEQIRFSTTSSSLSDRTITVQVTDDTSLVSNLATATIAIARIYDYGDAPDTANGAGIGNYQTTSSDGGAAQVKITTSGKVLSLGSNLDIDDGSLQNSAANADDNNGTPDDEDGVATFPVLTTLTAQTYVVPVSVSNNVSSAYLVGYIDFNQDGDFNDSGEKSATVTVSSNNTNPRTFNVTFTTPVGMTTGNTYARFRLGQVAATAESSIGASGSNDYGEIEDYQIAIVPADYGDAPSSYGNAGHAIVNTPSLYLGSIQPDQESGTQLGTDNGAAAVGDDNNGIPDDEDAFTTLANVSTIDNYDILVPVKNTSGGSATLHAWVDFDKDGQFESGEYKATTVANNITRVNLNWQIPSGTSPGDTYIRFRLTTSALTDNSTTTNIDERSIGNATNGEVEDYKVTIEPVPSLPPLSVGSCEIAITNGGFEAPALTTTSPTPYQTFVAGKIAAYNENDVPGWTSFADSYIELWRNGNNTSGNPPAYEGEQFAEINAYVNGSLYQDVYTTPGSVITWQFAHRGREGIDTMNLKIGSPEATVAQTNLTTGNTSFQTGNTGWVVYQGTYTVPAGQTTTRFEYKAVSTASSSQSVGNFIDAVSFGPLCDFGDAKSDYPVLKNNNGAAHVNDGVTFLGSKVRIELDGQPSIAADGDDGIVGDTDQIDDEDGVSFTSTLNAGNTASVDVVASVPGYLNAWIDFNQDNDWDDSGEKIFTDRSLTAGTNNLSLPVPANANIGNTFARFRFSTNTGTNSTGIVVSGEVEDYQIAIAPDNNRPLGSPFTCSSTFYITTGNGGINPQSLYDVNRSGSTYTFTQRGPSTSVTDGYPNTFSYNALAYNPVDNYLYAFVTGGSATTGHYAVGNVVKIGSDGILRSLGKPTDGSGGTLPITNYYSATMLSDGTYVIGQASNFAKLNVATSPPTILSTGSLSGVNFTDFAVDPTDPTSLSGAKIYGINEGDGTNRLVILNVAGNNPTIVSQASNSTGFGDNAGSQFVDSFGTLYYRSSTNNSLYRIDSDSTSPNYGQATLISTTPGGGNTDGASCLFSAIMQKEVQDTAGNIITTSPANKVVKYVYSIASGNVQNLTGVSFQDDLRTVANGNPINGTFTGTYTVSNGSGTVSFSNTNQTIQISNLVIPAQTQSTSGADKLTITAEVKVANTLTPGTYFNQSAIANLPSTYPSSIPSDYPLSPAYEDPTPLEVTTPIASDPKLLLVKRITAINPGQSDEIQFNNFMDDPGTTNDNNSKWPDSNIDHNDNINEYLRGVSNSSVVKPGDEVEYTIYFLSSGDTNAKEVKICDVVPDHMTFVKNTYGVELGIGLGFDPTALPTEPNLQVSNLLNDNDQGEFYGPGTTPPANLCKKVSPANTLLNVNGTNNDNGAVVVELEDLPRAIEAGTPTNSYGFIRFRAKVK